MDTQTPEVHAPLNQKQRLAVGRCAKAFREYGTARVTMGRIARAVVNLRLSFEKDGRPDYRGETAEYRAAVSKVYETAITDAEEREQFKTAIRYWISKELATRVEAGTLQASDLEEVGITKPSRPASLKPKANGVLTPKDALARVEEIVTKNVANNEIGPVLALQSIGREMGPVVAALRDDALRGKLPKKSLRGATRSLLNLTLDAAVLTGIDVEEFVTEWFEQHSTASNGSHVAA